MGIAAYPGSFNPPTIAHLAIAKAALLQLEVDHVHLVVSTSPLGKQDVVGPRLADRLRVLEKVAASRPWLGVKVTGAQLLADLAEGYDAVVLGADKWAEITDLSWYGGLRSARDEVIRRLPRVVVVPRPPYPLPDFEVLEAPAEHSAVSSTAARRGQTELMVPEAAAFDARTGAWTDARRYEQWLVAHPHGDEPHGGG
ncbi:MAG: hypothetical protein ACREDE_09610 [Thermoplasmata archaeon]